MWLYFLLQRPIQWDESYQTLWGCYNICPLLKQFHIAQVTQPELSSLTHLWVWGDSERFCSDVAFLLVLPKEGVAGERVYGLTMVWVHPYQARVSTIDDVVRKLILLTSSRPNWPHAFVQFSGDAYHVPLPKEGHLSAMTEGTPSNIQCRRIHQLEIHELLHSEAQVVYPKGLNGCLVLVITSLSESLPHGMTVFNDEPTFLHVDLWQFRMEECESKALFPGSDSTSNYPTCPAMVPPPKAEIQVSMTMEVSELLSQAALDTSGQALGSSTPKRPVSMTLGAPPSLGLEDSVKPVDTSSQASPWVSIPDDAEPDNLTLEEIYDPPSLLVKTLGPGAATLPRDAIQLQEEANRALACLLVTGCSLDAHWGK